MLFLQSGNEELKVEAMDLLKKVPSLRIRYAGKTIPAEKFAITMSERYVSGEKALIVPAFEFMYIWNMWAIFDKNQKLVQPFMESIDSAIKKLPKPSSGNN